MIPKRNIQRILKFFLVVFPGFSCETILEDSEPVDLKWQELPAGMKYSEKKELFSLLLLFQICIIVNEPISQESKQITKVDENTVGNIFYFNNDPETFTTENSHRKQKEMSSKIKTNLKYDACGKMFIFVWDVYMRRRKKKIFMINFTVIKIHQHFHFYSMYKFFICTK